MALGSACGKCEKCEWERTRLPFASSPVSPDAGSRPPAEATAGIAELASEKLRVIYANRERYVEAWIAETGLLPSESELVEDISDPLRTAIRVRRRGASPPRAAGGREPDEATPTLMCGNCGFAPNHPAAQLGEICVKCGCDGYRLVQNGSWLAASPVPPGDEPREPHPWYGPCDGFGPGGECSVCTDGSIIHRGGSPATSAASSPGQARPNHCPTCDRRLIVCPTNLSGHAWVCFNTNCQDRTVWLAGPPTDDFAEEMQRFSDSQLPVAAPPSDGAGEPPEPTDDEVYPLISDEEAESFEHHAEYGVTIDISGEGVGYSCIQPYDLIRFCRTVAALRAQVAGLTRERDEARAALKACAAVAEAFREDDAVFGIIADRARAALEATP
jgi:hypothetical protein